MNSGSPACLKRRPTPTPPLPLMELAKRLPIPHSTLHIYRSTLTINGCRWSTRQNVDNVAIRLALLKFFCCFSYHFAPPPRFISSLFSVTLAMRKFCFWPISLQVASNYISHRSRHWRRKCQRHGLRTAVALPLSCTLIAIKFGITDALHSGENSLCTPHSLHTRRTFNARCNFCCTAFCHFLHNLSCLLLAAAKVAVSVEREWEVPWVKDPNQPDPTPLVWPAGWFAAPFDIVVFN